MTTPTLDDLRREVALRAGAIGAPSSTLPTFGRSEDGARPHLEVDARGLHYVVIERGQELKRVTTTSLDDLLYTVFEAVTFELACAHELAHRAADRDNRRLMFSKQLALLAVLSPAWAEREAHEHEEILRHHPFDDWSRRRVDLSVSLRSEGRSAEEAWNLACERYSLPAMIGSKSGA